MVGEELNEPHALLQQQRLDGLWHQSFKDYMRMALIGRNHEHEVSFEATVRKAIDCRQLGYADLAQAVIYLTSHDVEGFRNERLSNFFMNSGVADVEKRTKLAFACLLTAVGIPMILAGDEFADQHDLFDANGHVTQNDGKQVDPVNFARLGDDWSTRIKAYVSRLIKLRTTYDALAVKDGITRISSRGRTESQHSCDLSGTATKPKGLRPSPVAVRYHCACPHSQGVLSRPSSLCSRLMLFT